MFYLCTRKHFQDLKFPAILRKSQMFLQQLQYVIYESLKNTHFKKIKNKNTMQMILKAELYQLMLFTFWFLVSISFLQSN